MSKKLKSGFKILIRFGRESMFISTASGGVKYNKKKITRPKEECGPLAVFDTLNEAEKFIKGFSPPRGEGSYIVVKCSYRPSETKCVFIKGGSIRTFLPTGTRLADTVTCSE